MSNLRVCIVSPLFHPDLGGVGRQAVQLTQRLKEKGIDLFVFARKMKDIPVFNLPEGINVIYIPALRPGVHNLEEKTFLNFLTSLTFSLMLVWNLYKRRHEYDLVHFHGASLPLIVSLPLLKLLRKKVIAKVLASGLGTEAGSLKGRYFIFGNMMAYIIKNVDSFIAISQEIADGLKNDRVHSRRIKRITNFIDTVKFCPMGTEERHILRNTLSVDKNVVINFTGRIVERKGVDVLINAFAKNKELLLSSILIIVGNGPDENKVKNLVSKLGINNNVRFIGHSSEVAKYYHASDIFVLPSYAEGMPNALLEAMACGLPVIASRIGGVVDVVEDGKSGILFEPGDVTGLASAMVRLLKDDELRHKIGAEARKRIVESFSIDGVADKYIKLYEGL